MIAGTAGLAQGSVDERIGQLEREMILRSERSEVQRRQAREEGDTTESSGGDFAEAEAGAGAGSARASTMRSLLSRGSQHRKSGGTDVGTGSSPSSNLAGGGGDEPLTPDSDDTEEDDIDRPFPPSSSSQAPHNNNPISTHRLHFPTLPPYVDARPTIKTYFKIYSPSRGGRMLSVYESAPDRFNFSQSWGWKSSTLMVDEGLLGGDEDDVGGGGRDDGGEGGAGGGVGGGGGGLEGGGKTSRGAGGAAAGARGDGKLRFMVVIGNI